MKNGKVQFFDRDECTKRINELFGTNTLQEEIAHNLGINQSTVSDLKKGKGMSLDTLYKIAAHYRVSFDYLVGLSPIKDYNITPTDIQSICAATEMGEIAVRGLLSVKNPTTGKGLEYLLANHYMTKAAVIESRSPGMDSAEITHDKQQTLLEKVCAFIVSANDYSSDAVTITLEPDGNMHISSPQEKKSTTISTSTQHVSQTVNLSEIVLNQQLDAIIKELQRMKSNHVRNRSSSI